jgi:hypothetical protein
MHAKKVIFINKIEINGCEHLFPVLSKELQAKIFANRPFAVFE